MNEAIIVGLLGSSGVAALVSGVFNLIAGRTKKHGSVECGLRMLMYDRIKWLGRKYINQGSIGNDDLEDLIAMHKCYHDDLCGNGYLDTPMQAVKSLPIRKDEIK